MPRTNVRKHPTKSSDEPSPARAPPVVASKVKVQQAQAQHTAPASTPQAALPRRRKRGGRTHAEPELPKAPEPASPPTASVMKETTAPAVQPAQAPLGTPAGLPTGACPPKRTSGPLCHWYLRGECKRSRCSRWHPRNLAPCRNFAEGRCKNDHCPRPHISSDEHPIDPLGEDEEESGTDAASVVAAVSDSEDEEEASVKSSSSSDDEEEVPGSRDVPLQKSDEICKNFQNNRCPWGRRCHRRHVIEKPRAAPSVVPTQTKTSMPSAKSSSGRSDLEPIVTSASPSRPTAASSSDSKPAAVEHCRDFLKGRCKRGKRCPYVHPTNSTSGVTDAAEPFLPSSSRAQEIGTAPAQSAAPDAVTRLENDESRLPCFMYMTRNMKCIWGRECRRLHPPVSEWKKYLGASDEVCERFLEGDCWLGENCWRRHPGGKPTAKQDVQPLARRSYEDQGRQRTSASLPQLVVPLHNETLGRSSSSASTSPETSPLLTDDASSPVTRPVCWDFLRGRCSRQHCRFAHVTSKPPVSTLAQPLTATSSWSSLDNGSKRAVQKPPSDHRSIEAKLNQLLGTFRTPPQPPPQGSRQDAALLTPCRDPAFTVQPMKPIPLFPPGLGIENRFAPVKPRPSRPPPTTMSINVLDAVHVVFGPGLQVQHVKTGFESRVVFIKGVPSKRTSGDLLHALRSFGEVSEVHLPAECDGPTMTVRATFPTHDQAMKAVAALDNRVLFGATVHAQLASQQSTALGKGSVHDGDVRLEFAAPHRVAYLGYLTEDAAREAIAKIMSTELGDCELFAVLHRGVPSVARFTVKVTGLPPDTKESDLARFCSVGRPMLDRPNYKVLKDALHDLFRTARQHGELLKITVLAPPFVRQHVLAWAHYASPEGAARAAKALNNRRFKFLGSEVLSATHTRTINYTLPRDVFQALLYDLVALRSRVRAGPENSIISWYDKRGNSRDAPPVGVKIAASKLEVLTHIKSSFEALLRGDRVISDGHNVWDPFFTTPSGIEFLERLQHAHHGVLINRDPRKCYISLFGPPAARHAVRSSILRKVQELRTQMFHTFPIHGKLIGLFLSADLMKLQQELGHENVVLDFPTQSLKIRGDDDALRVTRLILRHVQARHDRHQPHKGRSCPVCLGDVGLPVTLPCGHSWCKSCLEGYLVATVDTRVFPVTCLGDEGRCGALVPIHIAKEILRPEQFFDVVRASFLSYIHSRPDEFFYCPTPDCPQVYRSAAADTVLQCPSCLVRICAKCHVESHDGTTCARREAEDKRLFQQWSSTRDVKNCPGCKIPIERISGCNHIACTSCKAHICWVCLSTFKESGQVYEHMHNEHGGIGLEYWF